MLILVPTNVPLYCARARRLSVQSVDHNDYIATTQWIPSLARPARRCDQALVLLILLI